MNPFIEFNNITDNELESKINEITKKYFMTNNGDLKFQLSTALHMYKEELVNRRQRVFQEQFDKKKGLDNLIKIN
jgi:ribosomal protein L29